MAISQLPIISRELPGSPEPTFAAADIPSINFARLAEELGTPPHVLCDLDGSLRRHSGGVEPSAASYLEQAIERGEIASLSIVTNNLRGQRAPGVAENGWMVFRPFIAGRDLVRKPDRRFFERVLSSLSIEAAQALMIGDNPRTDIAGANALGIATCQVERMGSSYAIEFWRQHRGRRVVKAVGFALRAATA